MIRFWSILAAMVLGSAPGPTYEVYAVEYARLVGFGADNLILGADPARKIDGSMMIWVIKGEGRVILVDAGFYRQEFLDSWKANVADFVKPSAAVAKLGIKPEDVTDIVISHLHWDHADGADLFPKARVWVQRAEYEHYRVPANLPPNRGIPIRHRHVRPDCRRRAASVGRRRRTDDCQGHHGVYRRPSHQGIAVCQCPGQIGRRGARFRQSLPL